MHLTPCNKPLSYFSNPTMFSETGGLVGSGIYVWAVKFLCGDGTMKGRHSVKAWVLCPKSQRPPYGCATKNRLCLSLLPTPVDLWLYWKSGVYYVLCVPNTNGFSYGNSFYYSEFWVAVYVITLTAGGAYGFQVANNLHPVVSFLSVSVNVFWGKLAQTGLSYFFF